MGKIMKQNVVSREYKVMLKKERFAGSQVDLLKCTGDFWNAFKALIQDIVFDTDGNLNKRGRVLIIAGSWIFFRKNN